MLQMRLDYPLADRCLVAQVREKAWAFATNPPYVTATVSPLLTKPPAAVLAVALSHGDPSGAGRHSCPVLMIDDAG
jgi:hypothetical protein